MSFAVDYLRDLTDDDTVSLRQDNARRGFPGMIGSFDCCKWFWRNCPMAWHGQYKEIEEKVTVTFEAKEDERLWEWHAFFGMPR